MSAFLQLSALKTQLQVQAAKQAELARIQAEQKAKAEKAARLFVDTVGDVQALKPNNAIQKQTSRPAPVAAQRALDEQQVMVDCLSDHFGIEQLLDTDTDLSYKSAGIGQDVLNKLRRGEWAIQGQLDLHGCRVDQARMLLTAFIAQALYQGWRCVRVVHGKGLGSKDKQPVLKGRVRSWLVQTQAVIAFVAARPAEGGAGAVVVLLAAQN